MSTEVLDPARTVRACIFTLAAKPFAVDVSYTREVVDFEDHTIVPRGPSQLVGVANLRGSIIPILDIQPLLGVTSRRAGRAITALVVGEGAVRVAFVIEDVVGLESFAEISPFAEAAQKEYGRYGVGLVQWEDRSVPLLSVPKLLEALRIGMRKADPGCCLG